MCVSLASDSLETVEVITVKLDMVTASDMRMHHVLIILTLTLIQVRHTYLNHQNNKRLIISETMQVMSIKFMKINSPTKGLHNHCQSDNFDLHSRSQ